MQEDIRDMQKIYSSSQWEQPNLQASMGRGLKSKSFTSDEPETQQYGFQNFAMMIPERPVATYASAASIK